MDPPNVKSARLARDSEANQANDAMRQYWNSTVCEHFQMSDHYQSVAVLLIHWADWLDTALECGAETAELESVFRETYGFTTSTVILDCRYKLPQNQLNVEVANFVSKYDGPHRTNLLIVYYSGHGIMKKPEGYEQSQLFISGVLNSEEPINADVGALYEPSCHWQNAESLLHHAEADVLTIMDTCYATGCMNKALNHVTRSFETIAATHVLTPAPGEDSFTRALITSLIELQAKASKRNQQPFDTARLHGAIDDIMRRQSPNHRLPRLYNRNDSSNARHICLTPVLDSVVPKSRRAERAAGVLHLQVVFSEHRSLNKQQTVNLGRLLTGGAKEANLGITALDWVRFNPRPLDVGSTITIAVWLKAWVRRWRARKRRSIYQRSDLVRKWDRDHGDVIELLKRPRLTNTW